MRELALYIHWPFCLSKCPYCDFNSHVRDSVDQDRWRNALLTELDRTAEQTAGRTITSIFFGGGTPSLMPAATVSALLDRAAERWSIDQNVEITLEANPTSVENRRLSDIRAAGVNRVSLGVQALNDDDLTFLGRGHNVREALAAVETARRIYDRYSFDLIYGRPGQTADAWRRELGEAVTLAGDHLSLYQLTLEAGTPFHTLWRRGQLSELDEDTAAALFETTQEILDHAGMPAYEISNHAAPGSESRHNLTYWRYGDYAGIGPGAHGRLSIGADRFATQRIRSPEEWLEAVEDKGSGMLSRTRLDQETQLTEFMLMGLRLRDGVEEKRLTAVTGYTFREAIDPSQMQTLIDGKFLHLADNRLKVTPEGRLRLDAVLARLLAR